MFILVVCGGINLEGRYFDMKTKSEIVLSTLTELLESKTEVPINEGTDFGRVAEEAFYAAFKIWDKSLKSNVDKSLASLGFKRSKYIDDKKAGTFELIYTNKLGFTVSIYGAPFGGSSSSHYMTVTLTDNKRKVLKEFESESFSYIPQVVDQVMKDNDFMIEV